jgi:hypothetical protein
VAAYAYQRDGQQVRLWIYDPNQPDRNDVQLCFDITNTTGEVHVDWSADGARIAGTRIWCFFRTDNYNPHLPQGGRGHEAITVRDAIQLVTEARSGTLPESIPELTKPTSVRQFVRSI